MGTNVRQVLSCRYDWMPTCMRMGSRQEYFASEDLNGGIENVIKIYIKFARKMYYFIEFLGLLISSVIKGVS